jgi:hypothetical protein
MPQEDYLDGFMYHMSHLENLPSILKSGALLSQEELDKGKIRSHSIANREVQNLRRRIYVWDFSEKRYRPLHSYVPFYFTTNTPMLRNQRDSDIQHEIIIFEVNRAYIASPGVLFTDGNASNQQLSKSSGEQVHIIPATAAMNICRREYLPGGQPYGTNSSRSDFYHDVVFLDRVNWAVINRLQYVDFEEYKRVVHAEVLVPDRFPLDEMQSICVSTKGMVDTVRAIFSDAGLSEDDFDLPIVYRSDIFF